MVGRVDLTLCRYGESITRMGKIFVLSSAMRFRDPTSIVDAFIKLLAVEEPRSDVITVEDSSLQGVHSLKQSVP